ncbi:MAG: formate dehydrogenase, partial [Beijerinckiaceae bacterium]
ASAIGNHIAKFWEPRMRKQMYAHLAQGGAGLDPLPKQGLEELRRKDPIEQANAS